MNNRSILLLFLLFVLPFTLFAQVDRIVVDPVTTTLSVGEKQVFKATGYDANDNPVKINDPNWKYTGDIGKIEVDPDDKTQCTFTPEKTGETYLECYEGKPEHGKPHGSADIAVIKKHELSHIEISPKKVKVDLFKPQTFTAKGYDIHGNEIAIYPIWSCKGGVIDPYGKLIPTEHGIFKVIAKVTGTKGYAYATIESLNKELDEIRNTPSNVTLNVGASQKFKAIGYDREGNEIKIDPVWSATGGEIDVDGNYTATESGDYQVTASFEGITVKGTSNVKVKNDPQIDRIEVTPSNITMNVGDTQTFVAQGFDDNGNPVTIDPIWKSSGGKIDNDGRYTAETYGIHKVTAEIKGSEVTGHASINVGDQKLNTIEVTPSSITMNISDTQVFVAKGFDDNGNPITIDPIWSATGGEIDPSGLFTGTQVGTYEIECSITDHPVKGKATVHVTDHSNVDRIEITPSNVTLNVGDTQTFQAQGFDEEGNQIPIVPEWSATGGKIDNKGNYEATTVGQFDIKVYIKNRTLIGFAKVDIKSSLTKIKLTPRYTRVDQEQKQQYKADGYDIYGKPIPIKPIWSAKGGLINENGLYTAKKLGYYSVVVKDANTGLLGFASVNIGDQKLSKISISPFEVTMKVGETKIFTASGSDADGAPVTIGPFWSVDGSEISQNGEFTPTQKGSYMIQARLIVDEIDEIKGNRIFEEIIGETEVIVEEPSSVFDLKSVESIKIFPNPAEDIVKFSIRDSRARNSEIRILNSIGESVYREQLVNSQVIQLNISNLQSGVYFVVIGDQAGAFIKR